MEWKPKGTAYLCLIHEIVDEATTRFVGAQIFSNPPWQLTTNFNQLYTIFYQIEAESYDAASKKMVELIMDTPMCPWLRPWIDPSFEAHQKRFDMQEKIRQSRKHVVLRSVDPETGERMWKHIPRQEWDFRYGDLIRDKFDEPMHYAGEIEAISPEKLERAFQKFIESYVEIIHDDGPEPESDVEPTLS